MTDTTHTSGTTVSSPVSWNRLLLAAALVSLVVFVINYLVFTDWLQQPLWISILVSCLEGVGCVALNHAITRWFNRSLAK